MCQRDECGRPVRVALKTHRVRSVVTRQGVIRGKEIRHRIMKKEKEIKKKLITNKHILVLKCSIHFYKKLIAFCDKTFFIETSTCPDLNT
jgi:hypothetical protein